MIEEVGDLQTEVDTASGSVGEVGIAEVVVLILVADTSGHGVLPFGTALPLLSDTEGGVEDSAQLYVEAFRTVCAYFSENGRRQGVTEYRVFPLAKCHLYTGHQHVGRHIEAFGGTRYGHLVEVVVERTSDAETYLGECLVDRHEGKEAVGEVRATDGFCRGLRLLVSDIGIGLPLSHGIGQQEVPEEHLGKILVAEGRRGGGRTIDTQQRQGR